MFRIYSFFLGLIISILFLLNFAAAQNLNNENKCIEKGWQKISVNINSLERNILWKGPEGYWKNGAIIALHGGGGTYSNYCSARLLAKPMVEFSELAIKEGFAIFSLDSGNDLMLDENENPCGKKWDCLAQKGRDNLDLDFIEKVITDIIPDLRPLNSVENIFMTGISNGGFMTILAATHFNHAITAFAIISAGDPYGTHMDCSVEPLLRPNTPGVFIDNETGEIIFKDDACWAITYLYEEKWPEITATEPPSFKQFHNEGDIGVNISCMKKAQALLSQHGYKDDGPYIINNSGPKKVWKHFWLRRYNRPLIDFFTKFIEK